MTAVVILQCDCGPCLLRSPSESIAVSRQDATWARLAASESGWTAAVIPGGDTVDYAPGHEPSGGESDE
jgi:hypothetical protein